jgi:beta-fructofuranosidase
MIPGDRPVLHYTPRAGQLNDPVGLVAHDGQYHLFHQAVPEATSWGRSSSWGHAASPDLITWTPRPVALPPGHGDDGCCSGCLCVPRGGPATIFYTAVAATDRGLARIRAARPVDHTWDAWRKGAVVVLPPWGDRKQDELTLFRDPCVVRESGGWRMLVGAGYVDGRAGLVSFTSPDLEGWDYAGCFLDRSVAQTDPVWTGSAWECPQLLTVSGRDVLVVSVRHDHVPRHVVAAVGERVGDRFVVERWTRLGHGPGPYAPTAFMDADGRPGLVFRLRDVSDGVAGWAGALSVPYWIDRTGDALRLAPHPAVLAARAVAARADGRVLGLTWGAHGRPNGGLDVRTMAGAPVIALRVYNDTLAILGTGGTVPLVDEPVHVLIDHGIVEICTGRSLFALAVEPPTAPLAAPAGEEILLWWPSEA